jgi:hypothetical protein
MFFLANAFFKSIFVSFFILLWARHSQSKARKKRILPQSLGVSSQISMLKYCCDYYTDELLDDFISSCLK